MKGIILAGGNGTRLFPLTKSISKQLLPIYDKPMIYYPLSLLMLSGIREILVITKPQDQAAFQNLLLDGKHLGLSISYEVQLEPKGLADAFVIGEKFLNGSSVCLVLGDNIIFGRGLRQMLSETAETNKGATIFAYSVNNPSDYGVVEFDEAGIAISLEEKPLFPKSNYAIPGLYFYDGKVVELAKQLTPSPRGELEITDLNRIYLKKKQLHGHLLGRGTAWLDAGTHETLMQASQFVQIVQQRQGMMISCVEEISYRLGYITKEELQNLVANMGENAYSAYLAQLVNKKV